MRKIRASLPWIVLTLLGLAMLAAALWSIARIDAPLRPAHPVEFIDFEGKWLQATYYQGNLPAGVLLLPGFGGDQVATRSLASEFARSGAHVMTLDFSGHGRSPGGLDFDNAATDRLAAEALLAHEVFQRISGLSPQQIILAGHSMGGRVALQSAALNPDSVHHVILFGPSINLAANAQADFFTSVDDTTLGWVQTLGPNTLGANVLLISGAWDDILPVENARLLLSQMTGETGEEGKIYGAFQDGNFRQWLLLPRLVHNYEIVSPRAIHAARQWAGMALGLAEEFAQQADSAATRIWWWLIGIGGLALALVGGVQWSKPSPAVAESAGAAAANTANPKLVNTKRFFVAKLLLWLAALPLAAVLGGLAALIPLNFPAFNLIYFLFIGAYGLLMTLLYRIGRMPGVKGRLPFEKAPRRPVVYSLLALGIAVALFALSAAYARTGWFFVFPSNDRLWWLLIFTPFVALGFWAGLHEYRMVSRATHGIWPRLGIFLVGLVPFFLYTFLLAVLGSTSGMISGLIGLAILGLVLLFGTLILNLTGRPWLAAMLQALWLFWLILPQGALFRF